MNRASKSEDHDKGKDYDLRKTSYHLVKVSGPPRDYLYYATLAEATDRMYDHPSNEIMFLGARIKERVQFRNLFYSATKEIENGIIRS